MNLEVREEKRAQRINRAVFEVASVLERILATDPKHRYIRNATINSIHGIARSLNTAVSVLEDNVESDRDAAALAEYILDKFRVYFEDLLDIYRGGKR